jgi:hypothetical protein
MKINNLLASTSDFFRSLQIPSSPSIGLWLFYLKSAVWHFLHMNPVSVIFFQRNSLLCCPVLFVFKSFIIFY